MGVDYERAELALTASDKLTLRLAPGGDYQPGLVGHVRLNLATSAERLDLMVHRLATALAPRDS